MTTAHLLILAYVVFIMIWLLNHYFYKNQKTELKYRLKRKAEREAAARAQG